MDKFVARVLLPVARREGTDATASAVGGIDAAHEIGASSIVVTPCGGSRWTRLLTGDVALSLVAESALPVVVPPDGRHDGDTEEVIDDE